MASACRNSLFKLWPDLPKSIYSITFHSWIENSMGPMDAQHLLTSKPLRGHYRLWPLPSSSEPLGWVNLSLWGHCRRKWPIIKPAPLLLLSITCVKSDNLRVEKVFWLWHHSQRCSRRNADSQSHPSAQGLSNGASLIPIGCHSPQI